MAKTMEKEQPRKKKGLDKKILIACHGAKAVNQADLEDFQGGLKTLSEANYKRLREQIADHGFTAAVHVWENAGKLHILDGHQRIKTVRKMVAEGWDCPPVPVVTVDAVSYQEAKRILLAHASQFGTVEAAGLHDFMVDADISPLEMGETTLLPEINFDGFKKQFYPEPPTAEEQERIGSNTTTRSFNISYSISFNTVEEQAEWFGFLTWLKRKYADKETIGERIYAHCQDCRSKDSR